MLFYHAYTCACKSSAKITNFIKKSIKDCKLFNRFYGYLTRLESIHTKKKSSELIYQAVLKILFLFCYLSKNQ